MARAARHINSRYIQRRQKKNVLFTIVFSCVFATLLLVIINVVNASATDEPYFGFGIEKCNSESSIGIIDGQETDLLIEENNEDKESRDNGEDEIDASDDPSSAQDPSSDSKEGLSKAGNRNVSHIVENFIQKQLAALQAALDAEHEYGNDVYNKFRQYANTNEDAPTEVELPPVNWVNISKDDFIKTWSEKIDKYLSGSPLEGNGKTFAEAAWQYKMDPRWSPAISNTESSKGFCCFLPHNAWGWGQDSFDNWSDAIWNHVRGLSEGYGYSITRSYAAKYCPPNCFNWYNNTLREMNKINSL